MINFTPTREAARGLASLSDEARQSVLLDLADYLLEKSTEILEANQKDLDRMDPEDPKYDRLKLTEERLQGIANEMRNVAKLPCPLGVIHEERILDSGLQLKRVSVPLGVIGMIYEARPNVTCDVFAICFKTGNACVLKGGSDAHDSNTILVECIHAVLEQHGIAKNAVMLLPAGREHVKTLLEATGEIDVIIPRGSQGLIDFVTENAKVPVIETGAGIVHTYFDASGDRSKGRDIITNAKARRVSVCNALDCLIIHQDRLDDLPYLMHKLGEHECTVYADEKSHNILKHDYPANLIHPAKDEHFGTEFLSMKMSIKTVDDFDHALEHIAKYSSKHSEAIVAEEEEVLERFLNEVDAAAVYANTSTAFTDGAQFGLGAEIGISTQKLHARGPMALREMCSYKWVVRGDGQTRT